MADIRAFAAYRPREDIVDKVAALPYDVYNREEARAEDPVNLCLSLQLTDRRLSFPKIMICMPKKYIKKLMICFGIR